MCTGEIEKKKKEGPKVDLFQPSPVRPKEVCGPRWSTAATRESRGSRARERKQLGRRHVSARGSAKERRRRAVRREAHRCAGTRSPGTRGDARQDGDDSWWDPHGADVRACSSPRTCGGARLAEAAGYETLGHVSASDWRERMDGRILCG